MLRVWLLLLDILIRIGLVKLPQREQSEELDREQSEELDRHDFDRNKSNNTATAMKIRLIKSDYPARCTRIFVCI